MGVRIGAPSFLIKNTTNFAGFVYSRYGLRYERLQVIRKIPAGGSFPSSLVATQLEIEPSRRLPTASVSTTIDVEHLARYLTRL